MKKALEEARMAHAKALAPLSKAELGTLVRELYPVMVSQNEAGHTLNDNARGRMLVDLIEKMDRLALIEAAEAIVPLSDPKLLDQLKEYPADGNVAVEGVDGRVIAKIDTPAGAILIGGKEPKTYRLDEMKDVAAVIDLGHGNTYEEGTTSLDRPVLVVLNLGGSNTFRGRKPGIQGGAMLGVSMVVNREGNNSYQADDLAQASAIAGVGMIVEYGGKNTYRGVRRVQGQASAAWASLSAAAARTIITRPCGPRVLGPRWVSDCWRTPPATITTIAAASTPLPTSIPRKIDPGNARLRRFRTRRRRRHPAGGRRRHRHHPQRRRP